MRLHCSLMSPFQTCTFLLRQVNQWPILVTAYGVTRILENNLWPTLVTAFGVTKILEKKSVAHFGDSLWCYQNVRTFPGYLLHLGNEIPILLVNRGGLVYMECT